jgi:hypothetical protein
MHTQYFKIDNQYCLAVDHDPENNRIIITAIPVETIIAQGLLPPKADETNIENSATPNDN